MEHDTFSDMRDQLQQLRQTLENQKIINEKLLKRSYKKNLHSLRVRSSRVTMLAIVAMALVYNFHVVGFSWAFFIATELMMLGCLTATLITNRHIPQMDSDLVTAAEELRKFRMNYVNWLKIGIPVIVFWLSWMVTELFVRDFPAEYRIPFLAGAGTGIVIGLVIGLRIRRQIIRSAEELLVSVENLRGTE